MKDKFYELLKDGTLYQFLILIALIIFQAIYMIISKGEINDLIMGAIVTMAVGVPVSAMSKNRGE